jgi:hypothetical protein
MLFLTALELPGISIVLSAAVAIIGVLMYALCTNGKLQEIGRLAYFAGLLAFLLLFK